MLMSRARCSRGAEVRREQATCAGLATGHRHGLPQGQVDWQGVDHTAVSCELRGMKKYLISHNADYLFHDHGLLIK